MEGGADNYEVGPSHSQGTAWIYIAYSIAPSWLTAWAFCESCNNIIRHLM